MKIENEIEIAFSPGKASNLKKSVIKEFAPRFAQGAEILYVSDTAKKDLHINVEGLKKLGISIDQDTKLPDIVLYDKKRKWLFLIVAATAHSLVSQTRRIQLEDFLKDCKAHKIYVNAFADFKECQKHVEKIAWDTVVWIAEKKSSEHLIHFDGGRVLAQDKMFTAHQNQ